MNKPDTSTINPKILPVLGGALGVIYWIADTVIDVYLLGEGHTFLDDLLAPGLTELWMRCLVVFMMVFFAFYARKLLIVQNNITTELSQYRNQLELLVEERTAKLEKTNIALQEEVCERKKLKKNLRIWRQ